MTFPMVRRTRLTTFYDSLITLKIHITTTVSMSIIFHLPYGKYQSSALFKQNWPFQNIFFSVLLLLNKITYLDPCNIQQCMLANLEYTDRNAMKPKCTISRSYFTMDVEISSHLCPEWQIPYNCALCSVLFPLLAMHQKIVAMEEMKQKITRLTSVIFSLKDK